MKKVRLPVALVCTIAWASSAYSNWWTKEGQKLSLFPPKTGMIAVVEAKAPDRGVTARLHAECFTPNSEIAIRAVFVVLSEEMTPGPLGWRYQFDEAQTRTVQMGLPAETRLSHFLLGDASSANFRRLTEAKRFRLTLMPTKSLEFNFDFDVTGAGAQINLIPCREFTRSN
jgi:hypothetical protein